MKASFHQPASTVDQLAVLESIYSSHEVVTPDTQALAVEVIHNLTAHDAGGAIKPEVFSKIVMELDYPNDISKVFMIWRSIHGIDKVWAKATLRAFLVFEADAMEKLLSLDGIGMMVNQRVELANAVEVLSSLIIDRSGALCLTPFLRNQPGKFWSAAFRVASLCCLSKNTVSVSAEIWQTYGHLFDAHPITFYARRLSRL